MTEPTRRGRPVLGEMVDLARYPIDRLDAEAARALARKSRLALEEDGLCLLPGFVREPALAAMRREANGSLPSTFFCRSTHNAYLAEDDARYPADHPARRSLYTEVGSIARDRLPATGVLARLYASPELTAFIGAVLGYETFYPLADPLGALSVNVFERGGEHAWHFDESRFTVTLMLQPAEEGGVFEYVPGLRTDDDEGYDAVGRVLDGERDLVRVAPFEPGTLFLFAGRQSMHRVSRVCGDTPRLVAVLCYATEPGAMNSERVRKLFWGRTGPDKAA